MQIVMLLIALQGKFNAKDTIDFWGTKKAAVERPVFKDEGEAAAWFVNKPTEENAAEYLAWQRERLEKIKAAQEKLLEVYVKQQAGSIQATLEFYSMPDCPYCKVQERILERVCKWLPGVKVVQGTERVDAVPVIVVVVGGIRVRLDGVASELKIVQAMKKAASVD